MNGWGYVRFYLIWIVSWCAHRNQLERARACWCFPVSTYQPQTFSQKKEDMGWHMTVWSHAGWKSFFLMMSCDSSWHFIRGEALVDGELNVVWSEFWFSWMRHLAGVRRKMKHFVVHNGLIIFARDTTYLGRYIKYGRGGFTPPLRTYLVHSTYVFLVPGLANPVSARSE